MLADRGRGVPDPVRDGISRQARTRPHCWTARPGGPLVDRFPDAVEAGTVTLAERWTTVTGVKENRRRAVRIGINTPAQAVRFVLNETWGARQSRVYAFLIDPPATPREHLPARPRG
jgi:hypothetical protein